MAPDLSKQEEELDEFYKDHEDSVNKKNLKLPLDDLGDTDYEYTRLETFDIEPLKSKDEKVVVRDISRKKKPSDTKNLF